MQKEKLTVDLIKSDFELFFKERMKILTIKIPFLILLYALSIFIYQCEDNFFAIAIAVATTVISVLVVYSLLKVVKQRNIVQKGKFKIVGDLLSGKFMEHNYAKYGNNYYKLKFLYTGEFIYNHERYHSASKMYDLDDVGLNNYAEIGDKYYLIMCGNDIATVYNAKMFEPVGLEIEKAYIDEDDSNNSDE